MSEVSPCIQILKLLGCMVKSAKRVISKVIHCFSAHVHIFGKGTAGRIGDLDGPNPAPRTVVWRPLLYTVACSASSCELRHCQLLWSGAPLSSNGLKEAL